MQIGLFSPLTYNGAAKQPSGEASSSSPGKGLFSLDRSGGIKYWGTWICSCSKKICSSCSSWICWASEVGIVLLHYLSHLWRGPKKGERVVAYLYVIRLSLFFLYCPKPKRTGLQNSKCIIFSAKWRSTPTPGVLLSALNLCLGYRVQVPISCRGGERNALEALYSILICHGFCILYAY